MSRLLYITADRIGTETGGGIVTHHELVALCQIAETTVLDANWLCYPGDTVWQPDERALEWVKRGPEIKLAHFYSGTFTRTIEYLKSKGTKISYTAAAHNIDVSRKEHEKLGIPFQYPHLTDPDLWNRYVGGYRNADRIICPSTHSADCMRSYGCDSVSVIPHGVHLPEATKPLPATFTVGYLGAIGPDKGIRYLLQAWKELNYADATLVITGGQSNTPWMHHLIKEFGGGNIQLRGWVKNVSDFYNSISLYAQPSISEGFGIEVLEAMAHGRPVICSKGAGAHDICLFQYTRPGDVEDLKLGIRHHRSLLDLNQTGIHNRQKAEQYTWDKIRECYIQEWRSML